nr:IS3 family transposase [Romeria gracilis]
MQRKRYSAELKVKIALEAVKGLKTVNEIAGEHGVHPTQVTQWKKQVLEALPEVFSRKSGTYHKSQDALISELYQQIGQLKVELDWLKKKLGHCPSDKRQLIEPAHPGISLSRQCELIGLSRASWYYQPASETAYNEHLMKLIDRQFTEMPYYGVRRMTAWLRMQGEAVNPKRVRRLMRKMGLEAIYPKPNLSQPADHVRRYPYLLKAVTINAPNQVWSTDITYIPMPKGFVYLVAVMDWFSRYVLAWRVSNTMDVRFCIEALEAALAAGKPDIFNSDQGAQFTSEAFTTCLEARGIRISQDGRGRAFDNIFVERLWRSVKYEEVYLKSYTTVLEALNGLNDYFVLYNQKRLHQALDYQTPAMVHFR